MISFFFPKPGQQYVHELAFQGLSINFYEQLMF